MGAFFCNDFVERLRYRTCTYIGDAMTRNQTLFLFFVLGAIALATFEKVGRKAHTVATETQLVFQ